MNRMDYLDFDVLFEKSGEAYVARVLNSPCGQAVTQFHLPFNSLQVENLLLRVGRTRRGVRRLESPEMEACRNFGGKLFSSVFDNELLGCLRSSLSEGYRRGLGLRLRLRFSTTPELIDLPWEFLYDPARNQFLVLSVETPLVRYLELPQDVQPLPVRPPLKILVMIASPQDYPPLDVEREWAKLNEALGDLEKRGMVSLARLEAATLASLQRQLRRGQFHIFHFIGHGAFNNQAQDGVLLTEDEAGRGRSVSGYDLGTLLHDHRSLRLAVLNACEGARSSLSDPFAGAAQSLVQQGLPAVIAMQFEITDLAAITLAHEFYGALADGYAVDAALAEARKAIFAQGNDVEWATPVLYLRAPTGAVFQIEPGMGNSTGTLPRPLTGPVPTLAAKPGQLTDELKAQVERLYTEGLSAYWLDEWEKACESFEAVLQLQPDHPEAAARLEAAQRYRRFTRLSQQAEVAEQAGEWAEAVSLLEKLAADAPAYQDAVGRLEAARKHKQLHDLYEEARRLSQAARWQAVVNIFAQVASLDPSAPDPEGLLPAARRELAEQQRQFELESRYTQAIREIDGAQWENAARLLRDLQAKEPGYRQVERLLARAEAEIARQEQEEITRRAVEETPPPGTPASAPAIASQVDAERVMEEAHVHDLQPAQKDSREADLAAATTAPESAPTTTNARLAWQPGAFLAALRPAVFLGIGWFLASFGVILFINSPVGHSLVEFIHKATEYFLDVNHLLNALAGMIIGLLCGILLRASLSRNGVNFSKGWSTALIMGWPVVFLFPYLFARDDLSLSWALPSYFLAGGIGGIVTGFILRKSPQSLDVRSFLIILVGWIIALAIGQWYINQVFDYPLLDFWSPASIHDIFRGSLKGLIVAFIGGVATYYPLIARQAKLAPSPAYGPASIPADSPPTREGKPPIETIILDDSAGPVQPDSAQITGQGITEAATTASLPGFIVWRREVFRDLAIPALILGSGWFVAGMFSILFAYSETGYRFVQFSKGITNDTIGEDLLYALLILVGFGGLGGTFLGIWLSSNQIPLSGRRFVALVSSWIAALLIPFLFGMIGPENAESLLVWFLVGAVGGWMTVLILRKADLPLDRGAQNIIILGWAIGLALNHWFVDTVYYGFVDNFWSSTIATALFSGIALWLAAFIGGLVTLYNVKKHMPSLPRREEYP